MDVATFAIKKRKKCTGSSKAPNLAKIYLKKILKNYTKNIDLPVFQHFTRLNDKFDLRVDSDLTSQKKKDKTYTFSTIVV